MRTVGVAKAELGRRLDRAPSWVSRRLALVEALPEAAQESVRVGKVSVQVATKILVPLARANVDDCEVQTRPTSAVERGMVAGLV
ncbi:hypothetical protein [Enhygromyxa salina]|uniref:Uncharacterized protein n=1 Tax=Enhygromyxa salina TaxID=215803 RepID=A0A2S9XTF7_9BACT|nr:hypothetical protein [Enhygromyxa salina]PRP96142.1 hypothetical protein ENSA7_69560 [Enhygromyxa salina]